MHMV